MFDFFAYFRPKRRPAPRGRQAGNGRFRVFHRRCSAASARFRAMTIMGGQASGTGNLHQEGKAPLPVFFGKDAPGRARARSDAVLQTAMPGQDELSSVRRMG